MLGDISGLEKIYIVCGYTDMWKSIDGLACRMAAPQGLQLLLVGRLQPNRQPVGSGGENLPEKLVQPGGGGGLDGVAVGGVGEAEAVHDDESSRCFIHSEQDSSFP